MTTQANLNALITNSNVLLNDLQNLLGGLQPNVLLSDNPALYPSPVLALDGTWTLTQTQATGGIYEGRYSLVGAYSCATIDFISKTNYTVPGDNVGAQYRVCGASTFTNLAIVDDLENKQADALVIRSTTPFTLTLRLAAQWCYSIDFAQGKGITDVYLTGNWQDGEGYNAVCFGVISGFSTQPYNVALAINAPLAGTRLTSVSMTYNAQPKSATAYVATIRRDSLSNIIKQQPIGSGIDKVIT